MAADTTYRKGLAYLLHSDGTAIGGGMDATLSQTQELIETTNKGSSDWKSSLNGMRSWSVNFDGAYMETAELAGSTLDFTVGGTSVKGIKTITLELTIEGVGLLVFMVVIRTTLGWATFLEMNGRWPWVRARRTGSQPFSRMKSAIARPSSG